MDSGCVLCEFSCCYDRYHTRHTLPDRAGNLPPPVPAPKKYQNRKMLPLPLPLLSHMSSILLYLVLVSVANKSILLTCSFISFDVSEIWFIGIGGTCVDVDLCGDGDGGST